MPPKRASTGSESDGGAAKKAKANGPSTAATKAIDARFSKVSATRNAYLAYQRVIEEGNAYRFITTCVPTSQREDEDEEDEEDEGEEGPKKTEYPRCDGGDTCICEKTPADNPDYPWVVSLAGWRKYFTCLNLSMPRNPDGFGMHTFNNHAGYGAIEIAQNLLIDYVEAKDSWQEQWAVCEGMGHWLVDEDSFDMLGVDCPDEVEETLCLAGRMVLSTLARIEREDVVSEVQSLPVILAIWLEILPNYRYHSFFNSSSGKKTAFDPARFDDYILAWAKKQNITLRGPAELNKRIEECNTAKLPAPTDKKNDPYGFDAAFKKYKAENAGTSAGVARMFGGKKGGIGGDKWDVTSWTSAERKKRSYMGNKDPLGKKDMDALKDGGVMGRA